MKPDTTYPLHSDDDQQTTGATQPELSSGTAQPEALSKYDQPQPAQPAQASTVPWYLQPLTKTTKSPVTTTQTRPYVPRQPMPPASPQSNTQRQQPAPDQPQANGQANVQAENADQPPRIIQAPPLSPFRSQQSQSAPITAPVVPQSNQYQAPPRPPLQSPYQRPVPTTGGPKPFSQFGAPANVEPSQVNTQPAPKKSNKRRPIIWIALALLVVAGLIAGMLALWRNSNGTQPAATPPATGVKAEDRLYSAIENHLRTSNVRQVYDQTTTGADTSTLKIDATSNFVDPAKPKSAIKYELKSGKGDSAIEGAGELTVVDANEYFGKLTKPVLFYQGAEAAKPKENQWYQILNSDSTGASLLDPLSARLSINTSLGEIPIGNFSEVTREELMKFIKERKLYTIKNSEDTTIENKKMTRYSVDINIDVLNELNRKIVEATGGNPNDSPVAFTKSDAQTTEIWVNHEDSKIARLKIEREFKVAEQDAPIKEATNLVINYPNSVTIDKPAGAVVGSWPVKR